jgi:hypothetical protein
MTIPDKEIAAAWAWLLQEAGSLAFGQVTLTLIVHAGQLARIEKTVTEKTQAGAAR